MAANLAPRAEAGGAALDHAPSVEPVHRFIRQRAGAAGRGSDACDLSICGGGGGSFLDSSASQLVVLSASAPLRQIGGVEQRRISGAPQKQHAACAKQKAPLRRLAGLSFSQSNDRLWREAEARERACRGGNLGKSRRAPGKAGGAKMTLTGVRQASWQRIGGGSPSRGKASQPPRPRVMRDVSRGTT